MVTMTIEVVEHPNGCTMLTFACRGIETSTEKEKRDILPFVAMNKKLLRKKLALTKNVLSMEAPGEITKAQQDSLMNQAEDLIRKSRQ